MNKDKIIIEEIITVPYFTNKFLKIPSKDLKVKNIPVFYSLEEILNTEAHPSVFEKATHIYVKYSCTRLMDGDQYLLFPRNVMGA